VPIIVTKDPHKTEYDNGINNCEALTLLILPQSFTIGIKIATSGVLLKNIDNAKHVTYILVFPNNKEPSVPNVLRAR
jgi:hypothetical protein